MKILAVHTYYRQSGGEDQSFYDEVSLLREKGNEVITFELYNKDLEKMSFLSKILVTFWNREVYNQLRLLIRKEKPEIVHVHNTFLIASPAVFHAIKAEGAPAILTLRNYRLLCPNASFLRKGQICEECLNKKFPLPAIVHGCYRKSRSISGLIALMLFIHRLCKTWDRKIDLYIALTNFARSKFIEGKFPPEKIVVKPNFVYDFPLNKPKDFKYALFVGRLSEEKGINTLLSAWKLLNGSVPLKIVGDGPLAKEVTQMIKYTREIELLSWKPREEIFALMREAAFLVFPSEWYETFGRVAVEAFANSTPVIASRLGAMRDIVEDGLTGLLFEPSNPHDLAEKVEWAWTHRKEIEFMGKKAREEYEEKYSPLQNYEILMNIYRMVIDKKREKVKDGGHL